MPTAEQIATENNVSRETVKRAEQYAKAVDNIAKTLGNETSQESRKATTQPHRMPQNRLFLKKGTNTLTTL